MNKFKYVKERLDTLWGDEVWLDRDGVSFWSADQFELGYMRRSVDAAFEHFQATPAGEEYYADYLIEVPYSDKCEECVACDGPSAVCGHRKCHSCGWVATHRLDYDLLGDKPLCSECADAAKENGYKVVRWRKCAERAIINQNDPKTGQK